jgi:flagellar motor switch protein FliG
MPSAAHQLSGLRKSAMVLLSLDSETAGRLLERFPEDLVGGLRAEMKALADSDAVSPPDRESVLEDFLRSARKSPGLPVRREIAPAHSPNMSKEANFPKSVQAGDRAVATILESTVAAIEDRMHPDEDDLSSVASIHLPSHVMPRLERMPDRAILAILEQLDSETLVLALRGAGRAIRAKVLSNMAPTQARLIATRLAGQWPAALREIEAAQQRVSEIVFRLESAGEIDPAPAGAKEN